MRVVVGKKHEASKNRFFSHPVSLSDKELRTATRICLTLYFYLAYLYKIPSHSISHRMNPETLKGVEGMKPARTYHVVETSCQNIATNPAIDKNSMSPRFFPVSGV